MYSKLLGVDSSNHAVCILETWLFTRFKREDPVRTDKDLYRRDDDPYVATHGDARCS